MGNQVIHQTPNCRQILQRSYEIQWVLIYHFDGNKDKQSVGHLALVAVVVVAKLKKPNLTFSFQKMKYDYFLFPKSNLFCSSPCNYFTKQKKRFFYQDLST